MLVNFLGKEGVFVAFPSTPEDSTFNRFPQFFTNHVLGIHTVQHVHVEGEIRSQVESVFNEGKSVILSLLRMNVHSI